METAQGGSSSTIILLECSLEANGPSTILDLTIKTKESSTTSSGSSTTKKKGKGSGVSQSLQHQFRARRSMMSECVEAIIEYCRILYDVFPDEALMCVYKIGTTLTACNNWSLEEQSLKQLMSGFFGIKGTDIPSGSISSALKASIHELIQRSTKEEQSKGKNRILLFTQPNASLLSGDTHTMYQDGQNGSIVNIIDTIQQSVDKREIKVPFEVVLIKLDPRRQDDKLSEIGYSIAPLINLSVYYIHPSLLTERLSELTRVHYNLSAIRVTGIPMKETGTTSTAQPNISNSSGSTTTDNQRAIYDVVLLFPTDTSNVYSSPQAPDADGNKAMSSETILQWKSTRTVNTDTVPCSKVVRVSPLKIYSSPSICLMKHICSGKAVCLISPDAPEVKNTKQPKAKVITYPTHILLSHKGDVILHFVRPHMPVKDLPANNIVHSIFNSVPTTNLRIKKLSKILFSKDNSIYHRLLPSSSSSTSPVITLTSNTSKKNSKKNSKSKQHQVSVPPPPPSSSRQMLVSAPIYDPAFLSSTLNKTTQMDSTQIQGPMTKVIEKLTRYYPLLKDETILFGHEKTSGDLPKLLDIIKQAFNTEEYKSEEVSLAKVKEIILMINQFSQQNDARLFPYLSNNFQARKEAYSRLWNELLLFGKKMAVTDTHRRIVETMESSSGQTSNNTVNSNTSHSNSSESSLGKRKRETKSTKSSTTSSSNTKESEEKSGKESGDDKIWSALEKHKDIEHYRSRGRLTKEEEEKEGGRDRSKRRKTDSDKDSRGETSSNSSGGGGGGGSGGGGGGGSGTNFGYKQLLYSSPGPSVFHKYFTAKMTVLEANYHDFEGRMKDDTSVLPTDGSSSTTSGGTGSHR